jgi:pyruvate dehydrogenase E2 component (dihydrolipoamide acetyltransferase)
MPTNVIMPQMGESIAEGTVTKWLKKVGDAVKRDEPLFEISTDKVDAEIPAPAAGTLLEILVPEGKTVAINTVVARLGEAGEAAATAPAPAEAPPPEAAADPGHLPAPQQPAMTTPPPPAPPAPAPPAAPAAPATRPAAAPAPAPQAARPAPSAPAAGGPPASVKPQPGETKEDLQRRRSSPLVRAIAEEKGIDISQIPGTGISGRVTKADILAAPVAPPAPAPAPGPAAASSVAAPAAPAPTPAAAAAPRLAAPAAPVIAFPSGASVVVEPMSAMRKKIAVRMVESKHTSAHVTTVFEIDYTNIARLRERVKDSFAAQYGTKLSYMPFIFRAAITALKARPLVNASIVGDDIVHHKEVNLGMAVALDWGLIAPVIRRADDLSLVGLARAANDLAARARAKKLVPDEVAGGTFTITNPGVFGSLFGTPVINQPQVAIMGVGAIEKRAKVITLPDGSDSIAIKTMGYMALTFDHRLVDGAEADAFLNVVKATLEGGRWSELE